MSEHKFTKGLWDVNADCTGVESPDGDLIACCLENLLPMSEMEANVRLIALAPDLLEVVEKVIEWNRKYPTNQIYSHSEIKMIAAEMDEINKEAIVAVEKVRGEL